jgi:PAS domain S-box-containing protein
VHQEPGVRDEAWEHAPALLFHLGRSGEVRALNARWVHTFEIERDALTDHSLGERLSSRDLQAFYDALSRVQRDAEVTFEAGFLCPRGHVHPVRWTLRWNAHTDTIDGAAVEVDTSTTRPRRVTPPAGLDVPGLLGSDLVTLVERSSVEVTTVVDRFGAIRYESPSLTALTGHLPEELVGRHAMDLIHPEDQASLNHALRRLYASEKRSGGPFEYRWRLKGGGWRWASSSVVQRLADGKHDGWLMSTRDVTAEREERALVAARTRELDEDRARMRAELAEVRSRQEAAVTRRSETDTRRTLEGMGEALSVGLAVYQLHNGTFERVYTNEAANRLVRHARGLEALGPRALSQARTALLSTSPLTLPPRELSGVDGKAEVTPVMFGLGAETVGVLLTTRHAAPDRLLALNHELRTPLASTLGYLELALDGATGDLADDLTQAYSAAQQVRLFIDMAVEAARLEERSGDVYLERVQLKGLAQEVRGAWSSIAPEREGTVWAEASEVYTDRRALRLLMLALLATQRLERDAPAAAMRLSRTPRSLLVEFAPAHPDDLAEIRRLLEAPTSADARTMRELAAVVARGLTARLGGVLHADDTFTVNIPSRVMLRTPVGGIRIDDVLTQADPRPAGDGPLALVIDDDTEIHDQLRACLEPAGWRVEATVDGASGIQMARATRPDVIVLDVVMPSLDGWSVLSQLRHEDGLDTIPVVIQSIVVDEDLCRALGASASMTKPVVGERVVETLARFVETSTLAICLGVEEHFIGPLERALEQRGMRCVEVDTPAQALNLLREGAASLLAFGALVDGDLVGLLTDARRVSRGTPQPGALFMQATPADAVLEAEFERWSHGVARTPDELERALERALPKEANP